MTTPRLMITYGQVDPTNSAAAEVVVRRVYKIQQATRRNPKHPDFSGLDIGTVGSTDEAGGARVLNYSEWLGAKQKEEAKTLRSQREWRAEQAAERRRQSEANPTSGRQRRARRRRLQAPMGAGDK